MLPRSYKDWVYCFCSVGGLINLLGTAVLTDVTLTNSNDFMGEYFLHRKSESNSSEVDHGLGVGCVIVLWTVVYIIQFIWLLYGVSFMFRDLAIARLLYSALPPFLHILYLISNMCVVSWLLLGHQFRNQPLVALLSLSAGSALLHIVLALLLRAHRNACPRLRNVARRDYWLMRVLVHNGLAIHALMVTVMLVYQVTAVALDHTFLPLTLLHTIVLGVIALYIILLFVIDTYGVKTLHSWLISPYIAFSAASFIFILYSGKWKKSTIYSNFIFDILFSIFLTFLSFVLTAVKVRVALRSERERYGRTLEEEDVMLTSLDQSELDKVEQIDMIAKMFESEVS